MDESARLLQLANDRLRKGRVGIVLEVRGKQDWLYLRGTFPPKPGSSKIAPYQQRIALKTRATTAAIKQAEAMAKVVGGELNLGQFDWRKWSDAEQENPDTKTVAEWIEEFEQHFWRSRDRANLSQQNTWEKAYFYPLNRLPKDAELNTDLLLDWIITNSNPNTRLRGHYCTCAMELSKLAGLPLDPIREVNSNAGIKPINPRELPSDEAIVTLWQSIKNPGWRYLYGLMATYGLRNHECFGLDYGDFPIVRVRNTAKTGTRPIEPLYPEWVEVFELNEPVFPKNIDIAERSNAKLGEKITSHFQYNMPWGAYNLRHCYARRCAEFSIPPDVAAKLMGHSLRIHQLVYQAWIGEKIFLEAARRFINRDDRPKPPRL